jgi:hypothetical protein
MFENPKRSGSTRMLARKDPLETYLQGSEGATLATAQSHRELGRCAPVADVVKEHEVVDEEGAEDGDDG